MSTKQFDKNGLLMFFKVVRKMEKIITVATLQTKINIATKNKVAIVIHQILLVDDFILCAYFFSNIKTKVPTKH